MGTLINTLKRDFDKIDYHLDITQVEKQEAKINAIVRLLEKIEDSH